MHIFILTYLQYKITTIAIVQICVLTLVSEEDEIESVCASVQEEIGQVPKQDVLIITGDQNVTIGNK